MRILNKILVFVLGVCLTMGVVYTGGTAKVSAAESIKNKLTVSGGTLTESEKRRNKRFENVRYGYGRIPSEVRRRRV